MAYITIIGYTIIEALFSKRFILIISIINNNILLFFWKNVLEFSKKYKNGKRIFFDELFSNKNYSIIMVNISMNV